MITELLQTAWELFDNGDAVGSEALYLQCLTNTDMLPHDIRSSVYMGLIYTESFMGKFQEARLYAQRLMDDSQNKEDLHVALHQSGMVERMAGNYQGAMVLFQKELAIIQNAFPKEDMLFAANLYEQGILRMNMGDSKQAQELMNLSLTYAQASCDPICIGCAYRGLGEIFLKDGQISRADTCFLLAISAFEKADDPMAVQEVENLRTTLDTGRTNE